MRFARVLWRLIVLTFSFVVCSAAVVAAGISFYLSQTYSVGVSVDRFGPDWIPEGLAIVLAPLMMVAVAMLHALAPWVVAVTATELLRWRGLLVHLGAGFAVALAAGLTSGALLVPTAVQTLAALGLLAGFVHWLIAGRNAGRWSEGLIAPEAGSPVEPVDRP